MPCMLGRSDSEFKGAAQRGLPPISRCDLIGVGSRFKKTFDLFRIALPTRFVKELPLHQDQGIASRPTAMSLLNGPSGQRSDRHNPVDTATLRDTSNSGPILDACVRGADVLSPVKG